MAGRQPSLQQQIDASRRAGRELAQAFIAGARPTPVQVRLALQPGEFCVGQVPVAVLQWLESDGAYMHKSGGWMIGGGVVGTMLSAAVITTNVVGNQARKSRAAQEAAAQWRQIDSGHLFVTNRRFCIQGATQWNDIWFHHVRMSDCDSQAMILQLDGNPPTALTVPAADYWFVMFNKLAYDKVMMPPPPTEEPPAITAEGQPGGPRPVGPQPTGPQPTRPNGPRELGPGPGRTGP
jgi:hypothetical protein